MTRHGRWPKDPLTWCGVPKLGMDTTEMPRFVDCRRCLRAFDAHANGVAAAATETRRRGAPITTGRGGVQRKRLHISLSPEEARAICKVAGAEKLGDAVAWARAQLLRVAKE